MYPSDKLKNIWAMVMEQYAAGVNKPYGVDKVTAVAKYFNVSVDYLLGHQEKAIIKNLSTLLL